MILGWIVPGGGHMLLKRGGRGALVLASVSILFLLGLLMRGALFQPQGGDLLTTVIYYGGFVGDVLSGLPFTTLPEGVGPAIMAATHRVLRPGGAFLVYQYTARARELMGRYFARIDKGYEPINVPPCVISWGWKD